MNKPLFRADLKLVLLGESSVGKSALVTRFTTGKFHRNNATIGAAFTTKTISWENESGFWSVTFEIWDTAGQERYRSLAPMYYRNTDVALVVFDVSAEITQSKAESWIQELQNYIHSDESTPEIVIKVVGNKIDLLPGSSASDVDWMPVSAKTGAGVNELFEEIAKQIPLSKFASETSDVSVINLRGADGANITPSGGCAC
ncbi:LADA_0H12684g1_1 [Lachancea dasiensis]|uniref:LADA_0H12684g1_1 n=1 Tax=Lachancea dasiensis TaxID=1072105 RepID=A0A1G4K3U0_9SACH|nr:LADA_0H12684g1_1 [Lachancea dasiensis]